MEWFLKKSNLITFISLGEKKKNIWKVCREKSADTIFVYSS